MSGEPSTPRRERLTRERVLRAALTVADAEGLAALSMRRVAVELGVETMALYRYTVSKDDLLDGLVETLFLEVEERLSSALHPMGTVVPEGPPVGLPDLRDALHGIARELYRVAVAHPNIISLCASRPLTVPLARRPQAVLRVHERLLALLRAAGLDERAALRVYRAFISWVLGYIVIDLRAVVDDPDEPDPAFRLGLHRLPARDFPMLRAYGPALAERGGEEELTAGLDALLASLGSDTVR
ncbi:TetR/AcrR family transcriptional regulator [Streptomyces sp. NBC_00094]|uniref:TetR/AcrR family transcriptional regulator n=1 Tax=Streptomyces sp. NBC_00094 TaxID=2903620 RepID=UPI002256E1C4|nr:TetR/AcrR family transcriptional regulator [Streptomyces sp. NBC_00094]MCX5395054.1 TetR/AcrR family transcriptional regulator [Streptomyces sp. NBC_00094]